MRTSTSDEEAAFAERPQSLSATWTVRYAISALVAVVAVDAILAVALGGDSRLILGIGGLAFYAFVPLTLVPLYRQGRLRFRDLGLRPTAPGRAVGLVVLAVIAVAITNLLWLQGVLGKSAQSQGITVHGSAIDKIVIGVTLCVLAPVIEEIFFRGLLYRALRNRMRIVWAALIAGFLFGAVHGIAYPVDTLPPRMVFGVIVCLLYERTGSLYPPMALHGLIDGSGFESAVSGQVGIIYAAYGVLGLGFLAYAGVRRWRRRSRLRRKPAAVPPPRL